MARILLLDDHGGYLSAEELALDLRNPVLGLDHLVDREEAFFDLDLCHAVCALEERMVVYVKTGSVAICG